MLLRRTHRPQQTLQAEIAQAIGFQILKMGDHGTAVELLAANAADYPRSTGAAFALGRASATAGDRARATAEFRRAVALDPNNKRAAAALRQIEETK